MKLNINDEQGIEFLNFIFERELKPPFRIGKKYGNGDYLYYNRDNECIGWLYSSGTFSINNEPRNNIEYKVCQVFGYSSDTLAWLFAITPYLKSWMEDQLNVNLNLIH